MKENKDKELVTMVIRIPRYKKKMIENIANYVSRDTEGMSQEDLYDFYYIGDIYREEYRNE